MHQRLSSRPLFALALLLAAFAAQAQSTPAKKELVGRILKLQQPGIEAMAQDLAQQPAMQLLERVDIALPQRIAADKRDAVARDIQGDVKKYIDETVPLVRDRAVKLAPSTIGALLEEKFSEEELKQVVAIIESPVYGKFQQLGGDMQKALLEKLVAETRVTVETKVKALDLSIGRRLGVSPPAAAAPAAAPKAAAKPASK
jgi:hypothetical protein